MVYPYSIELQQAVSSSFDSGNFGLWFNKLIPLNNAFKACDRNNNDKNVAPFYLERYGRMKTNALLKNLLEQKHNRQKTFCQMQEKNGAKVAEIRADLESPLITGIGQTHPNEVGMTFDHSLGIPYLPATGVKGLVRLAHILNLIKDKDKARELIKEDELDDANPLSLIPDLFGGDLAEGKEIEKCRGKVLFLDAYPEKVPELHVDIMNPHYVKYYGDDTGQTPPADYLEPVPVKFLTVQKGEVFVFRAIFPDNETWRNALLDAFRLALTEQGFGAKTAVGYGRFKIQGIGIEKTLGRAIDGVERKKETAAIEIWRNVYLTYAPGNQEITAISQNKKATYKGKDLILDGLRNKLLKNKKATVSKVEVEPVGKNFRIVKIIP